MLCSFNEKFYRQKNRVPWVELFSALTLTCREVYFWCILYFYFQKLNFNYSKYTITLTMVFKMYLRIFSECNYVEVEIFSNNRYIALLSNCQAIRQ